MPNANTTSPWATERSERRRKNAEKKHAILRAAAIAFSTKGFHQTSMDDIARGLAISKPTVYYHFKSKKHLFEACASEAVKRLERAAKAARDYNGTAADRLAIYLSRSLEYSLDEFGRALNTLEIREISVKSDEMFRRVRSRIDKLFRKIISEGILQGEIDECFDPKLVSFAIFGAFNFIAVWYKPSGQLSRDEVLGQYYRIFFDGLRPRPQKLQSSFETTD